jgi:hypothetical protein
MLDNLLIVNRAEKNMNSSHLECREAQGEGAQRVVDPSFKTHRGNARCCHSNSDAGEWKQKTSM